MTVKVQSEKMTELHMRVQSWRQKRMESNRLHHVNDKGELRKIDLDDEHKQIIDETSKLDKLSDCSAEVPQEAEHECCQSETYASQFIPSSVSEE